MFWELLGWSRPSIVVDSSAQLFTIPPFPPTALSIYDEADYQGSCKLKYLVNLHDIEWYKFRHRFFLKNSKSIKGEGFSDSIYKFSNCLHRLINHLSIMEQSERSNLEVSFYWSFQLKPFTLHNPTLFTNSTKKIRKFLALMAELEYVHQKATILYIKHYEYLSNESTSETIDERIAENLRNQAISSGFLSDLLNLFDDVYSFYMSANAFRKSLNPSEKRRYSRISSDPVVSVSISATTHTV